MFIFVVSRGVEAEGGHTAGYCRLSVPLICYFFLFARSLVPRGSGVRKCSCIIQYCEKKKQYTTRLERLLCRECLGNILVAHMKAPLPREIIAAVFPGYVLVKQRMEGRGRSLFFFFLRVHIPRLTESVGK